MLNFDYLKALSENELTALAELYRLCDLAETRQYTRARLFGYQCPQSSGMDHKGHLQDEECGDSGACQAD